METRKVNQGPGTYKEQVIIKALILYVDREFRTNSKKLFPLFIMHFVHGRAPNKTSHFVV